MRVKFKTGLAAKPSKASIWAEAGRSELDTKKLALDYRPSKMEGGGVLILDSTNKIGGGTAIKFLKCFLQALP